MNLSQLKTWEKTAGGGTALLTPLAGMLEAGTDPARTFYSTFELSLNSSEPPSQVKLSHLHFYPPLAPAERGPLQARKAEAVRRALGVFDQHLGGGWPVTLAGKILDEFCRWGALARIPAFGCEWDAAAGRVSKATLYTYTRSTSRLRRLCALLGIPARAWLLEAARREQDCIGVDLKPGGAVALKLYKRHAFEPARIADAGVRARCAALHRKHPVRHLMFLNRVGLDGALSGTKTILRLQDGIAGERLAAAPGLDGFGPYLASIAPKLKGQTVYHICFEGGALEVYFRRTRAPWLAAADGER